MTQPLGTEPFLAHLARAFERRDPLDAPRSDTLRPSPGGAMRVGYVVLYVKDADLCRAFWIDQVGMVEKSRMQAGDFVIARVGFADQPFAFELVPLALMKDNPDGLDLATPSICFAETDLEAAHARLTARGVQASPIGDHFGMRSFAFSDPEGKWFAVAG